MPCASFFGFSAELVRTIQPSRGVPPVQRDPGPSLHVMPDDACVVSAPAPSVDAERPTVSPILPPAPASQPTPVRPVVVPAPGRGKFLCREDPKLYLPRV